MSLMPFANSLMLDFRCVIVPRFVYSTYNDFEGDTIDENGELRRRIAELAQTLHRFTLALGQTNPN
jgi:FMN reductase